MALTPSPYNDKTILYVDPLYHVHVGVVVGQSSDGQTTYIAVYRHANPDTYDMEIKTSYIPALIEMALDYPVS